MSDALSLTIKIAERADKIAVSIYKEISLACGSRPEFEAIMLHAVERKIMDLRHLAQRKAAGVKS